MDTRGGNLDIPIDEDMQDKEQKPKVTYICGGML